MDRDELSAAMIQDLGQVFAQALGEAAPALARADLDGIERRLQAVGRQVLGQVVEQVLAARAAGPRERPPCPACGGRLRLVEQARRRDLQGLVGDYTLWRPTYSCYGCGQGHAPLDAEVGLGAGALSPGLARVVCRGGIDDSFSDATDLLAETLGVQVRSDLERRTTEGMGAVAEAAQQAVITALRQGQAPPAPEGVTLVVVEVDGVQAPLLDGWHEMKVGRVAPLGPGLRHHADSGRTHLALGPSVCCAGLETAELFWYRMAAVAGGAGLGRATRTVVVLADGADWIWKRAAQFVGGPGREVVEIVDIYHAYEHLWTVGNAVFGRDTLPARVWVERLKGCLYAEGVTPVLAALDALAPPTEAATEAVRTAQGYFTDHTARMNYPAFVARQFPVGSGAIESMCKMLIEEREKGSGMRWSAQGAQAVATLRALHRSGQWAAFWQQHPQRQRLLLCPRVRSPRRAPAPATQEQDAGSAAAPLSVPPASSTPPSLGSRRPAANHPWRRQPLGRPRCA